MARKAAPVVDLAPPPARVRSKPQAFPGFAGARTCGNCDHFEKTSSAKSEGVCHNGISGRIKTTEKHGCGHGFYPDASRWPLRAGPGGVYA